MKLLGKMFALVADKFKDKTDKQGLPYILHCIYVMQNCGLKSEAGLCKALGHDLYEDCKDQGIDLDFLVREFNLDIAMGIYTLSHDKDKESYEDYIKKVVNSIDKDLVYIKAADLEHNTQVSRLKDLSKKNLDRLEKYFKAYTYIKSELK